MSEIMKENKDIKEANKKLYEISQYEALRRRKMIKLQKDVDKKL